jgi:hypothetical protein
MAVATGAVAVALLGLRPAPRHSADAAQRSQAPAGASTLPATGRLPATVVATATTRPTPSAHVGPTASPPPFVDDDAFWVDGASRYRKAFGTYQPPDECSYDFCPTAVQAFVADAVKGITIATKTGAKAISGGDLREIEQHVRKAFPTAILEDVRIDGIPTVEFTEESFGAHWMLTVVGARLYGFRSNTFFELGGASNLREFTWGVHFFAPACWMTPCPDDAKPSPGDPLLAFDAAKTGATWTLRPPAIRSDVFPDVSMRQFDWRCDGCQGWVRISIGTTMTGPIVAPTGGVPVRIPGKDMDGLRASWRAAFPGTSFTPTTVGSKPALWASSPNGVSTLLVIHRDWVVAITSEALYRWDLASSMAVSQFLEGLSFLD